MNIGSFQKYNCFDESCREYLIKFKSENLDGHDTALLRRIQLLYVPYKIVFVPYHPLSNSRVTVRQLSIYLAILKIKNKIVNLGYILKMKIFAARKRNTIGNKNTKISFRLGKTRVPSFFQFLFLFNFIGKFFEIALFCLINVDFIKSVQHTNLLNQHVKKLFPRS